MIQIYSPGNMDYQSNPYNGDMVLMPTYANVHAELNGEWEAEVTHPADKKGRWKYIEEDAVLKMPSFNGKQLFRIRKMERGDSEVTAYAHPIFMDAMDECWIKDVRPTGKTGKEALDLMLKNDGTAEDSIDGPRYRYWGTTNIQKKATAYYQYKNLIEALVGDEPNSFLNRWGGEVLYDNYTIIINDRIGADRGAELRYGRNIAKDGIKETVDMEGIVTRIYPKGYNGRTTLKRLNYPMYYDSPLINKYATVKKATITFDDVKMWGYASEEERQRWDAASEEEKDELGYIICKTEGELAAALEKRCKQEFDSGIDKPKLMISVNMEMLSGTELYKGYEELEEVSLGDTVRCIHARLGIAGEERIRALDYDSIKKKVRAVTIGSLTYDYFRAAATEEERTRRILGELGGKVWPGDGTAS